jgi:uncharacterized membrane protein
VSDLVVLGYDDTTTALAVMDKLEELQESLVIELDDAAVIVRNQAGKFRTITNHHATGVGAVGGLFWGFLFGVLFFIPFLGMALGAGLGAVMGKITESGIDKEFIDKVRDLVKPGTSAVFLIIREATPDKVLAAIQPFGGTVLQTSLSGETERRLQEALHGGDTTGVAL